MIELRETEIRWWKRVRSHCANNVVRFALIDFKEVARRATFIGFHQRHGKYLNEARRVRFGRDFAVFKHPTRSARLIRASPLAFSCQLSIVIWFYHTSSRSNNETVSKYECQTLFRDFGISMLKKINRKWKIVNGVERRCQESLQLCAISDILSFLEDVFHPVELTLIDITDLYIGFPIKCQ